MVIREEFLVEQQSALRVGLPTSSTFEEWIVAPGACTSCIASTSTSCCSAAIVVDGQHTGMAAEGDGTEVE